jgi:hypothetical protein
MRIGQSIGASGQPQWQRGHWQDCPSQWACLASVPGPTAVEVVADLAAMIDPDRFGALDDRALALLPMLDHFRRRSGLWANLPRLLGPGF